MSRGLVDTTVFIATEVGRPLHVGGLPEALAVSVVTVGELRAGVLSAGDSPARIKRLDTYTQALALEPIPIDESVAEAWARLRILLREAGLRMPVNDSWIAATALAHGLPLVTQDADYVTLDELAVIRV